MKSPAAKQTVIALLAAEPSGDLQAGALARRLKELNPDAYLVGVGGQHSRDAGVEVIRDVSMGSVVGPLESIPTFFRILDYYQRIRDRILTLRPDVTVMIDAPAIHMRLGAKLREHGLKSVYYFPPSAWSRNPKRILEVKERCDAVVAPFAFTAENYRALGVEVHHFGHPLVDLYEPISAAQARSALNLPEGRYVALLPGSRAQEIRFMTPLYHEVAVRLRRLHPDLQFLMPTASAPAHEQILGILREKFGSGGIPPWLHVFRGLSKETMAAARVAVITSGSATLEAALLDVPLLLAYKVNKFDFALGWALYHLGLFKLPRFGLPNLVLQENVALELLQHEASPGRICSEVMQLLEDGPYREQHLANLARVREALGRPGVVDRVAQLVDRLSRESGSAVMAESAHG